MIKFDENIEKSKDKEIEELKQRLDKLEGKNKQGINSYAFSDITFDNLNKIVTIERDFINKKLLNHWLNSEFLISSQIEKFLQNLIDKNIELINLYDEEDLKVNFIVPLILKIDFFMIKNKIRGFYHESLKYETDKFIFNGKVDFILSKGLIKSEKPYFFIQEFKKGKKNSDPEPQLLAELISAVELNKEKIMKGAYIIGESWNFVILERLEKHKYQYFVSRTFNCTNIEDLKGIYKNLMFIKNEILINL